MASSADRVGGVSDIEGLSGVVVVTQGGQAVMTATGGGCTTATCFQIASVSKNFAAALVLMLVQDGLLDLHEPVRRWLPEAPPSWSGITLHHLLSNSSGVGHWTETGVDPSALSAEDETLRALLHAPLLFEPGTRFSYSSPGFLALAVAVERAMGTPFGQLLAERILQPLGLTATTSGAAPSDVAPGHHGGEPVASWDLSPMTGAGNVCSTADDLVVYVHALATGKLVSETLLALMRTPHATLSEADRTPDGRLAVTGYGYGHWIGTFDGRPAYLHTGDNPGYKALVGWLPDGVGIVGLSNEDTVQWEVLLATLL
jgi:CubicO group peptidase (beta-lactamase class C family)